jgi:RNA polymerase sigma-70 factor (ECF subfamily)
MPSRCDLLSDECAFLARQRKIDCAARRCVDCSPPLTAAFALERARLLRLCARFTGEPGVAEDLVQETLFEAWLHRDRLTNPVGVDRWLASIARNVCRRWLRQRNGEAVAIPYEDIAPDFPVTTSEQVPIRTIDFDHDLDREDLAVLLDRALTQLSPTTRSVLLQHYVDELPQSAIAAGLGMTEGTVAVRIHRGKVTMRRLLASPDFREMAVAHGLAVAPDDGWTEMRIWCPHCGQSRMIGRWATVDHDYSVRCPDCFQTPGRNQCADPIALTAGLKGFRPAMSRIMTWAEDYFRQALVDGGAVCPVCGRFALLHRTPPSNQTADPRDQRGVHVWCETCGVAWDLRFVDLVLWLPEGQRFWREQERIRLLPEREVEAQGQSALITTYESVRSGARFEVISARDTYDVLGIYHSFGS